MTHSFQNIVLFSVIVILAGFFVGVPDAYASNVDGTYDQSDFIWRNDDGSEVAPPTPGATSIAAENTEITGVSLTAQIRLRIGTTEGGTCEGNGCKIKPQLEFSSDATGCTDGSWTTITTITSEWQMFTSSNFTDGDVTTQQITAATFAAGRILDLNNPQAGAAITITISGATEYEWTVGGNSPQASKVYFFRSTLEGTPYNSYTNCAKLTTAGAAGTTLTQNDFIFYVDNDALTPTDIWGNPDLLENTVISAVPVSNDAPVNGDEIRLRFNITVGGSELAANAQAFKLRFVEGADCPAIASTSYSDVGASGSASIWRFSDPNDSLSHGTALTTSTLSESGTVASGSYIEGNTPTVTNPSAMSVGENMEWDASIQNNGAGDATTYCFRLQKSDDSDLDTYDNFPRIGTKPGTANFLRHGNFFSGEQEKGFFWAD